MTSRDDLDLNTLTTPTDTREVFGATNAWEGADKQLFVDVQRGGGGLIYQVGFDPVTAKHWLRWQTDPAAGAWSDWLKMEAPPPEPPVEPEAGRTRR
jgi:hypothetical protein